MARSISGIVESDGDRRFGEGFYSNKLGDGTYMIDFDQPFNRIPAVVCTPVSNIGEAEVESRLNVACVAGVERGRVKVLTGWLGRPGPLSPLDIAFSFIAVSDSD